VKSEEVKHVMKRDLSMSYQKINKTAVQVNAEHNLVLRQRYAIKLLSLTQKKTVLINVDESWLDCCEYRRRKWNQRHSNNSLPS